MKRAISCSCLAAAFAVSLSAQAPSTSSMAQPDKAGAKPVTITGCLRAGATPGSFVLANVKADKPAASADASTPPAGATGTAGKSPESSTVSLAGSPAGVTLADHVGHQVSITGTLAPQGAAPSAAGKAGENPPAEPGAAAGTASKAQSTLNVTAFSMVAGSCAM